MLSTTPSSTPSTMLTQNQIADVMRRFPAFELSYETVSHKKVPNQYDLCIAIPQGKKAFLWFTFLNDIPKFNTFDQNMQKSACSRNVALLATLGKDKKVVQMEVVACDIPCSLAMNTVIYGSICPSISEEIVEPFFVFEDIYFYKGLPLAKLPVSEKLGFLYDFLQMYTPRPRSTISSGLGKHPDTKGTISIPSLRFVLPVMWRYPSTNTDTDILSRIPYTIHHLQYRCLTGISSYLNEKQNDKIYSSTVFPSIGKSELPIISIDTRITTRFDYSKPQYKIPTIFEIRADLQYDIYHLYAYGKGSARIYCGITCIPNCKTSVLMNGIFRKIRENQNLDAIEESDDEEDFQDMRLDKYVDLSKTAAMECYFNNKFKQWIPIKSALTYHKIVHISKL